ncbi:hypothetical protein BDY21DRAFT_425225 [Lineolata rhizophorae]|uniref:FHA domain-containing protein n=1 Tax=Lineolata rhizophorae TaxID=578093 RepID=A0A6A6NL27_9PEZI|nr:hypothetical protein BDY21DRAFT_425225 [Lineolata rhizophorae]
MWLLENEGNLFQGKKLWLRPGSSHLFGRTKQKQPLSPGERDHFITDKTVSRRHLVITVKEVPSDYGSLVHKRSEVEVKDDSRVGTLVDGVSLKGASKTLTGASHTLQLGTQGQKFRLRWHPVVLTFSVVGKSEDEISGMLQKHRTRLEPYDIKVNRDYVVSQTSHVVASKRNTPKGLQALVDCKFIVTEAYIDAIVRAASTRLASPDEPDSPRPSLLEDDYEKNWPGEIPFLPERGREPVDRPAEFYRPDPARSNLFSKYIFIFRDQGQFDPLQDPINTAGGKVLLYDFRFGETAVDDFVQYVRNAAGSKGVGNGSLQDKTTETGETSRGGVVIVKPVVPKGKKSLKGWLDQFEREVSRRLNRRPIEQNEFLDAILMKDTSVFTQPVGHVADQQPTESRPAATTPTDHVQASNNVATDDMARRATSQQPERATRSLSPSSEPERPAQIQELPSEQPPPKRRAIRTKTASRFKGFDDFDASQFAGADLPGISEHAGDGDAAMVLDSQPLFVGASQPREPSHDHEGISSGGEASAHDGADAVDDLFPAAAAMKRRRLADGRAVSVPVAESKQSAQTLRRKKEEVENVDVLGLARERREAQDEAARQDAENLRAALQDMDIDTIRKQIVVDEVEVVSREPRRPTETETNSRWDERWNGRKNFKRFRRKAKNEPSQTRASFCRGQKVIVGLQEVKGKDYGLNHWLDEPNATQMRADRQEISFSLRTSGGQQPTTDSRQNQPEVVRVEEEEADENEEDVIQPTKQGRRPSRNIGSASNRGQGDDQVPSAESIPDAPPRRTRAQERLQSSESGQRPHPKVTHPAVGANTQAASSETQRSTRSKRAAGVGPAASKEPPSKRTRAAAPRSRRQDDSDDSDEGLKFRFTKRK